jgi:Rod binding domain-containing protein
VSIEAGLPAGAAASAPEWVRKGSPELQHDYALGLEFEQMLAQQLSQSMTASAGLGEEGGEEEGSSGFGGAGSSMMSSMLPGAFASGVTAGGGLGLAAELARDMQSRVGTAAAPTSDSQTAVAPTSLGGVTPAQTTGGTVSS